MLAGLASTNGTPSSSGRMGLKVLGAVVSSNAPGALAQSHSALNPCRRFRASKHATGFRRHWRNWGDERRVPMPIARGVPMRGDQLGSRSLYLTARASRTGG